MQCGDSVALAAALAAYAHSGQTDKAGKPYMEHPTAVAARMKTEEEKIVAYLHDVVEDTFVDNDTIRNRFGNRVADAVAAMTRGNGENYMEYIKRLARNPTAKAVKLADLDHNMDLSRLPEVTPADLTRAEQYRQAKEYLLKIPE